MDITFKKGGEAGRAATFDFWALTPICDPHPSAFFMAKGPILPWALPLAGSAGRASAHAIDLEIDRIIGPRNPAPASFARDPRNTNPLVRFAAKEIAVLFSVLMGPMPGLA